MSVYLGQTPVCGGTGEKWTNPFVLPLRRKPHAVGVLFSVIFACGELYCGAVIFGLRRVIMSEANNKVLPVGQVLILRCAQLKKRT